VILPHPPERGGRNKSVVLAAVWILAGNNKSFYWLSELMALKVPLMIPGSLMDDVTLRHGWNKEPAPCDCLSQ